MIANDIEKNLSEFKILKLKKNPRFNEVCETGRDVLKEKI